jgi:hypothetical protein
LGVATEEKQWGEAAVDLRLGFSFTKLSGAKDRTVSVADGLGSFGRSGLWSGPIVLEMMDHGPLKLELTPLLDRPCQVTFSS